MHFNVSTCYGMQIILYLTRNKRTVSSAELSENLHISQRYIMQIARKLRNGHLIETHIGTSGGYKLNREASDITIFDVVVMLEGDTHIPECVRQCSCDALYTALCKMKVHLDSYFKSLSFEQLAGMDTSGTRAELFTIAESNENMRDNLLAQQ